MTTYWLAVDRSILKRINRLIDDALRDPFEASANPNPCGMPSQEPGHAGITECVQPGVSAA